MFIVNDSPLDVTLGGMDFFGSLFGGMAVTTTPGNRLAVVGHKRCFK